MLRFTPVTILPGDRGLSRNFPSSLPLEFRSYLFPFYSVFATRIFTSARSISSRDDIVSDREKKKKRKESLEGVRERERERNP